MSEPGRESIPTSFSNRSHRPTKKRALTPSSQQSAQVDALFANPERAENGLAVGPKPKVAALPPEIVANVQGSSAGAGSGEFHVYKASRRREYERLRLMDEEVQAEEAEKEFREKKEERERTDEAKLSKNRAKREKMKKRMEKKKLGDATGGMDDDGGAREEGKLNGTTEGGEVKRKLGAAKIAVFQDKSERNEDLNSAANGSEQVVTDENAGVTIHDDD